MNSKIHDDKKEEIDTNQGLLQGLACAHETGICAHETGICAHGARVAHKVLDLIIRQKHNKQQKYH